MIVCLSTVQKLNKILFVHETNRVYGMFLKLRTGQIEREISSISLKSADLSLEWIY